MDCCRSSEEELGEEPPSKAGRSGSAAAAAPSRKAADVGCGHKRISVAQEEPEVEAGGRSGDCRSSVSHSSAAGEAFRRADCRLTMEEIIEGKDYSFPKEEEKTLEFWERIDAFQTQLKRSEGKPEYVFYDGPPFATGLPHYGHILAGTIKDVVTRFQTALGHHVTRRFGWDTHGLPVEYEIDQKLGIKTRDQVLEMGIDKYNDECLAIVMRYREQWRKVVSRVGRWIDFDNDYKTLDPSFMESVWWVFKQLVDKDLVYRGFKVCFVRIQSPQVVRFRV